MATLRQIVEDTAEIVAALRSSLVQSRAAVPDDAEADESRKVFSFGPKAPCDVDTLDLADREAATLIAWAEFGAYVRIADVWRYRLGPLAGQPRGLLYDDLRPVLIATDLLLDEFDHGWHDEQFEAVMRRRRRATLRRHRWLAATFSADEDEADAEENSGQLGLNII
ncbi:hypothetical protein BH790_gp51 [Gordonia phage Gsput1]|uniref:Uncharacterized protein n=1 Tax=Gordonia phage Gsput1 TaxID=1622193 RepID=A0A0E3T697_9CAUD|nr:hypothetical protein BH790_gp51 [Gordonia phage Gsput1]AKC03076.1 hypothetical protein Gsput1_51 [Gordonia phage Gsput1]